MSEQTQILDMEALLLSTQKYLDRVAPDPAYRRAALSMFSRSIRFIHAINPNCWSINFGREGPFLLMEHEWAYDLLGPKKLVRFHVYLNKLDPTVKQHLIENAKVDEDKSDLWSTIAIQLPEQENLVELLWPAYTAYLQDKARYKIHGASKGPHRRRGAGLVEYIRKNGIDPDLPQPGFVPNTLENPMDIRLAELVQSFTDNYLSFTPWQVATFYTALQTKGFVILSGISGTGKTKLAQAFAHLLPQPNIIEELPQDLIKINVQPYMLKYNRIIIPRAGAQLFSPIAPGQTTQVKLSFDDKSEECKLQHAVYTNTDYIQILLKGEARIWFGKSFKINDTVILEPISDSDDNIVGFKMGKPEKFSKSVPVDSSKGPGNYLFLSVRPDWRDSKSLFGYYNPIDQEYHSTPFLEFIKKANASYQGKDKLAWFVLLDEMNLARVEYYFSDLLSVMESGRDDKGWSNEPIRLDYPMGLEMADYQREIKLPPNLYFVGTVNVDETTHAFSPKVLDRAFTLELTDADFTNYPVGRDGSPSPMSAQKKDALRDNFTRQGKYARIDKTEIRQYFGIDPDLRGQLTKLNAVLQPYDLHFGYRVVDEIAAFLANADANGFYDELSDEREPLDAAILMKVLPKFHGSRTKLEEPLKEILAWCQNPYSDNPLTAEIARINDITQNGSDSIKTMIEKLAGLPYQYKHTAQRVIRMLRALYTSGFAAFG